MKRIFLIITVVYLVISCTETSPTNSSSDNDSNANSNDNGILQQVYNMYFEWAQMSRNHNYEGMLSLCYPGGNFEGRTNVCKSQWDMNTESYYTFDTVEIIDVYKNPPSITVRGNVTDYQGPGNPSFYNGFYSSAKPLDGNFYSNTWKLDGINSNYTPFGVNKE